LMLVGGEVDDESIMVTGGLQVAAWRESSLSCLSVPQSQRIKPPPVM
jgi:hypothetical protein